MAIWISKEAERLVAAAIAEEQVVPSAPDLEWMPMSSGPEYVSPFDETWGHAVAGRINNNQDHFNWIYYRNQYLKATSDADRRDAFRKMLDSVTTENPPLAPKPKAEATSPLRYLWPIGLMVLCIIVGSILGIASIAIAGMGIAVFIYGMGLE